ncbi:MAG: energy transducer TonB [Saprospiraceae bacterium]|jgi:protein TonB|nr:energy transducer TonB [Saprospiraceae bacterium]
MIKVILLLVICAILEPATGQEANGIGWFSKSATLAPEKPALFIGHGALQDSLQSHLQYPQLAKDNCIEGEVMVLLRFSEQGRVESAKILKGIGFGCDEEALRLAMLFSQPAGVPAASSLKLSIRFRLR